MTMHVPNQQFCCKVKESQEALPIVYCDCDELVEIQGLLLVSSRKESIVVSFCVINLCGSGTLAATIFGFFQMASNCLSELDFVCRQYRPHTMYQHPEESILSIDYWFL